MAVGGRGVLLAVGTDGATVSVGLRVGCRVSVGAADGMAVGGKGVLVAVGTDDATVSVGLSVGGTDVCVGGRVGVGTSLKCCHWKVTPALPA